jgi:DNA-binding MarR family transcriptional regulator
MAKEQARSAADPQVPLKLDEFLPYRLNVVASLVSLALSRIYVDRYGIGVPEWRILVTLGEFEIMTAKAVGAHSHMHKTKVSRAVSALERRKLIVRRENRDDRREALLSLTPAGRAIYHDLAAGRARFCPPIVRNDRSGRPGGVRAGRRSPDRALQAFERRSRRDKECEMTIESAPIASARIA